MTEESGGATTTAESSTQALGRKAGRGLRWSLLGILATKVGSFGMGLVLARLLTPADFGSYAIALAATGFLIHINDVGIIAATVQWRGVLAEMAPTATTLAALFSTAVYGIFWCTAPPFAALAGNPDAAPVVRLLTVVILIDGVTAVRVGALMRDFRQDKLTHANVVGFVVNAVLAITLALHGAGPYSFAVGQVAGAGVTGVLVLTRAKVPITIGWDRAIARRLIRFGMPLAASLGIEAILLNADYVVVGRILGATALGFYLLAFNISSWVQGIVGTAVRYVSMAGFSRLAEQDDEMLSHGVRRTVPLLITGVMPIAVLMAVLAPELVVTLYGSQWLPAAPVLRFLVVLTVVRLLTSFTIDILASAGATWPACWLNLGWALAVVPALIVGTRLDGMRGTAVAHAGVAVLIAIPLAAWALHRCRVRLAPIGPALVCPLLAGALAAVTCLAVAGMADTSPFVTLATAGTASVLVYTVVALPRAVLRQIGGRASALIRARVR